MFISNRVLPIDRRTLLLAMKKYGTAAGLPAEKQQFHALKHSIGTHILDAGEDICFAKDWLGHKNIQNTTIYSKFSTGTRDTLYRVFKGLDVAAFEAEVGNWLANSGVEADDPLSLDGKTLRGVHGQKG